MSDDEYIDDDDELSLFIEAQDVVWDDVLRELEQGQKTSHWMWFVFPQLAELGRSNMAQLYGIEDLAEAAEYLKHPELNRRLVQVSELMLAHKGTEAEDILGDIDARKLRSSMTLFAAVPDAPPVFRHVLDAFYDGAPCSLTELALSRGSL